MESGNGTTLMGLALMAGFSVAGIHSAVNPSYFTLRAFGAHPEARAEAKRGLAIGLVASTVASLAIYLVFKKAVPALVAEATAIGLAAISYHAIYSAPVAGIPRIEQQVPPAPPSPLQAHAGTP
jgi:hypothetical protein